MSNRLRAAVIGMGMMGLNHARVYRDMDGVELVAVCDVDEAVCEKVGEAYNFTVSFYRDFREMLRVEQPDIVSVAVPTSLHWEVALAVIGAGCHLLVEKPIASTLALAFGMVNAAEQSKLKLAVGHIERFNPAVIELRRRLDNGELGKIYQVSARRLGPFPSRMRDVGVVIDLAIHDLDVMRYILGSEVTRVYAETGQRFCTPFEDALLGTLRFESGAMGSLNVNWLTPVKTRELVVTGERGIFTVNYLTQSLWYYDDTLVELKVTKREPLRLEIEDFVAAVREDKPPTVTGEEAMKSLEVALALVRSGITNEPIELEWGAK